MVLLGGAALTGLLLLTPRLEPEPAAALLLLHGLAGLAAAAGFAVVWPNRWRRFWRRRGTGDRAYTGALALSVLVSIATGVLFLVDTARRGNGLASAWSLPAHTAAGAALPVFVLLRAARIRRRYRRILLILAAAIVAMGAGGLRLARVPERLPDTLDPLGYFRLLASSGPQEFQSPFFPGLCQVDPGNRPFEASGCCKSCHAVEWEEWRRSTHRSAGFADPYYAGAVARLVREQGARAARYCAGCHEPERLVRGGAVDSPPLEIGSHIESEGVGCLSCHGIRRFLSRSGDGAMVLGGDNGVSDRLGRAVTRLFPTMHAKSMRAPVDTPDDALCGACHRMSVNLSLNHYKYLRVQDEYGDWLQSPESGRSARALYPLYDAASRPPGRDCVGCHMGGRQGHVFPGWSTALYRELKRRGHPVPAEAPLRSIRIDLFALRSAGSHLAVAPLSDGAPAPAPGSDGLLTVVVSNTRVGHRFPAGTTDSRECWLDLQLRDERGRLVDESGAVDPTGSVDPEAHFYRRLWLDREGKPVIRRNLQDAVSSFYDHTIPAGGSDVVRYRFQVPRARRLVFFARLRYRSIALETARELGLESAPPIETLATARVSLVGTGEDTGPGSYSPNENESPADRWNHYGVGCLLEGDGRSSEAALATVKRLAPRQIAGYLNLGRLYLLEGQPIRAAGEFTRALEIRPADPEARAWMGAYYLQTGHYPEAAFELESALESFPDDPSLWLDLGSTRLQQGKVRDAVDAFEKSLEIDPDQAEGHYQLMRCYQALGDPDRSQLEQSIYLYLQDDEGMTAPADRFARAQPIERREALAVHEHELRPVRAGSSG